jgi:hypothetical protein
MLSMKTLRVAIVTMGSALLLGSGVAMAQDYNINLNGAADEGMDAPVPLVFAQETLPAADSLGRRALELEDDVNVAVEPRRAIGAAEVFLRIDLTGARFGGIPEIMMGADVENLSGGGSLNSGGAGMGFAVFAVSGAPANGVLAVQIPDNAAGGDLLVTASSGNVTAAITAYSDPDDALDEVGARGTFAGSGTIIRLVSGLTVTIKAADTAVASVNHGFVRFLNDAGTAPTGQARLGWLGLEENTVVMAGVRNADTGEQLVRGDILNDEADALGTVSFNVMGNLDIGAFRIKEELFQEADGALVLGADGNPIPTESCDAVAEGGDPDRGTLVDSEGMMLISKEGDLPSGVDAASSGALAPNIYLLCVNVDVTGPMSNMYPIPNGDYSATAHFKTGTNVLEASQMAGMEGDLASIKRNGASVEIPYLTTSEKHNQRLIIVNRGTRPVAITSITFTTEGGTDVELSETAQAAMDAGLLVVPGNSTYVARMDQTIVVTGDSRRTAASIAFAATPGALSVATAQINLSDGSTDTVVYEVK